MVQHSRVGDARAIAFTMRVMKMVEDGICGCGDLEMRTRLAESRMGYFYRGR